MKVHIKSFDVDMEVKAKGIEFEVRSPGGGVTQLGDCVLTMTGLIWCKGKTGRQNGIKVSWEDFIEICGSDAKLKAAVKAAKAIP